MRVVLWLALALELPACVVGQRAAGATPATMLDHQTCVDSTRRWLGIFLGDYRVDLWNGSDGDSTLAQAHFGWELGGCLMIERFAGERSGKPYGYLALWGTSGGDLDRPVQRTFAHSQHGVLSLSEGRWNERGDTLVLSDSALVRGRWIQQRWVVSRPDGGSFIMEGRRSDDGGRTWIVTQRARYARTRNHP